MIKILQNIFRVIRNTLLLYQLRKQTQKHSITMRAQVGKYYFGRHRSNWGIWQYECVTESGCTMSRFVKDVYLKFLVTRMVTRLVTILLQNTPFLPFLLYSLLCLIVWNYIDRRALLFDLYSMLYASAPPSRNTQTKKPLSITERLSAVRTGLEPVTPCVTGMYSNQLN